MLTIVPAGNGLLVSRKQPLEPRLLVWAVVGAAEADSVNSADA